jgi:hypothetical protein
MEVVEDVGPALGGDPAEGLEDRFLGDGDGHGLSRGNSRLERFRALSGAPKKRDRAVLVHLLENGQSWP